MGFFALISYIIERVLAHTSKFPRSILFVLIAGNIAAVSYYPIYFIRRFDSHPVMGVYMMLLASCTVLKLISFHHVLHDVRRQKRLIREYDPQQASDSPRTKKKKYMLDLPYAL